MTYDDKATNREWDSGVGGAQCDECGRTTIVRGNPITDDPFGEPVGMICRPCAYGLDDDYEEPDLACPDCGGSGERYDGGVSSPCSHRRRAL